MATANAVGFQNQTHQVRVFQSIEGNRSAFFKTNRHILAANFNLVFPKGNTHNRIDDHHAAAKVLQVFGFVGRTQHIGVGGVGFFRRHLVTKARLGHERRHFRAAAELVNKRLVKPRFVNFEGRVGQQTVAVKALNVIAFEGAAVAPNVDIVFFHGGDKHGAGDCAANGGGVEVSHASR